MFNGPLVYVPQVDQPSSNFNTMQQQGFLPKNRRSDPWTPSEATRLMKAVKKIANGEVQPVQKDHSYYIAHYEFHDTKSPKQVQYMINKYIRKQLKKEH